MINSCLANPLSTYKQLYTTYNLRPRLSTFSYFFWSNTRFSVSHGLWVFDACLTKKKETKKWIFKFCYVQTLCNNSRQHTTTCNRVCKWIQHVTSNNVASICMRLTHKSIEPWLYNGCCKVNLSGPFGNFLFHVILTISYLRACSIVQLETSSLPNDSVRLLFKQIEIFSGILTWF